MQDQPEGRPFSESNLDSAEYRERLKRKLNCLIAVLEVATAKVRQSLAGPAPDVERLLRIRKNLQDTLDVCMRARTALEKRGALPSGLTQDLAQVVDPTLVLGARKPQSELPAHRVPAERRGARAEMTSDAELRKFASFGKIERAMLAGCDVDELARKLQT
jgi:hypothetical protein